MKSDMRFENSEATMSKAISGEQKERRSDGRGENAKSALPKPDGTLAFSLTAGAIGIGVALLDQAKAAAATNTDELKLADLQAASDLSGQIKTEMDFSTEGANGPFAIQNAPAMVAGVESGQPMTDPADIDLVTLLQKIEDFLQHMEAVATQNGHAEAVPGPQAEGHGAQAAGPEQYASLDTGTATDAAGTTTDSSGPISGGGHVVSPAGPSVADSLDQIQDIAEKIDDLLNQGGLGSIPIVGPVVPGLLQPVDDVLDAVGDLVGGLLGGGEDAGLASQVGELVEGALDGVSNAVDDALDAVGDLVGGLLGGGGGSGPISQVADLADDALGTVSDLVGGLTDAVGNVVGDVTGTLDDVVSGVVTSVTATLDGVSDLVGNLLGGGDGSDPISQVADLAEDALGTVGDLVGGLTDTVGDAVGDVTDTLDDVVSGVVTSVSGTLDGVSNLVGSLLGGGAGSDPVSQEPDLAEDALDTVSDVVGGLTDTVGDLVGGVTSTVAGTLDNVVGGVVTTVTGALDGLLGGLLDGGADTETAEGNMPDALENGFSVTTAATGFDPVSQTLETATGSLLGQEQPNIFEAAESALQLSDGLISLLTPTISFIGQPIVDGNDHHDFANSNGSLLHGLI